MANTWNTTLLATIDGELGVHEPPIYEIAVDNHGDIYFTKGYDRLYRLQKDDTIPMCIIKDGSYMREIVWNGNNILYICNLENHRILSYNIDTGTLSTLAGNGEQGHQDGNIKDATFYYPYGIAMDMNGDLYITEWHCVRKINLSKGTVETIAGSDEFGYLDGEAKKAKFDGPRGIAVSSDGTIYVADWVNCCIRQIKDGIVSTIAGTPGQRGNTDGRLRDSKFISAGGLILDDDGTLLVADGAGGIRRLDINQDTVRTLPLNIDNPRSLETDSEGNLYVGTITSVYKVDGFGESRISASLNNMTTWKHIRLFLVGDSGAGKTSVVRWLKGDPFISEHNSTDSVDVTTADINSWKSVTFDIKDYMAALIQEEKMAFKPPVTTIVNSPDNNNNIASNNNNVSPIQTFENPINEENTNTSPEPERTHETMVILPATLSSGLRSRLRKTQNLSQAFHVWDFAGQEEYYNTHHFFLSDAAIYLLVVDISKPKQIQRIQFWIDSIRFYAKDAPIFIIGTHKDQVDNAEKIMNQFYYHYEKHIHAAEYCISVCCDSSHPTFVSPETVRSKLINIVQQHPIFQIKCKLSWMLFFDQLMDVKNQTSYGDSNNKVDMSVATVSMKKAAELASSMCKMQNEDDIKEALLFFHKCGFLLYYDIPKLYDIIFVKPTDLVHVLRTIITGDKPIECKPNGTYKNIYHSTEAEVTLFQSKGVVSQTTLQKLWIGYPSDLQEQFKKLLQQFGLALSNPAKPEDLIFPCLVTTASANFPDTNVQTCTSELQGVPPLGFQSQLIVQLLHMVRHHNPKQKSFNLFQGGCVFLLSGFLIRVIANGGDITIQIHDPKHQHQKLASIFKTLFDRIEIIANGFGTQLELITSHCFHHNNNKEIPKVIVDLRKELDFLDYCCSDCQVALEYAVPVQESNAHHAAQPQRESADFQEKEVSLGRRSRVTKKDPLKNKNDNNQYENNENDNNAAVSKSVKERIIERANKIKDNQETHKQGMITNFLHWMESRQQAVDKDESILCTIINPTSLNIKNILAHLLNNTNGSHKNMICPRVDITELNRDKEIGAGAFATCYKCKCFDSPAALKSFKQNLAPSEKFFAEATLLWILYHPHIVKLYGYTVVDGYNCLVMELMDMNLDKWLENNQISDEQCFSFSLQIADGLQFLHAVRVVHRDICGSNVLVKDDSLVKICDIGEAKILTNSVSAAGHDVYLSPEELLQKEDYPDREDDVEKEADIWKLGLVLLRIWSRGKFQPSVVATSNYTREWKTTKDQILPTKLDPKTYCSQFPRIVELITECLNFSPNFRPTAPQISARLSKIHNSDGKDGY